MILINSSKLNFSLLRYLIIFFFIVGLYILIMSLHSSFFRTRLNIFLALGLSSFAILFSLRIFLLIFTAKVAVPVNFQSEWKLRVYAVVSWCLVSDSVPADDHLKHMHILYIQVDFEWSILVPVLKYFNKWGALVVQVE